MSELDPPFCATRAVQTIETFVAVDIERTTAPVETIDTVGRAQTLDDRWVELRGHPSGFDYMRVALATTVLLWHSYHFSYGTPAALDFWRSPAGFALEIVLPMFFSLSGFLVASSLERNSIPQFLALRVIRIYPALCAEVFLSAFVLGPLVTTLPLHEYFASPTLATYLLNVIGWIHYLLPGVFTQNPYSDTVNISLWTVPFELECYIALPALVLCGYLRSQRTALLIFALCSVVVFANLKLSGQSGTTPAGGVHGQVLWLCFLAGTLIYRFKKVLPYTAYGAILAGSFAIVMLRYNSSVFFAPIFVAYTTVCLGMLNPKRTTIVNAGDFSYGLYLYAAPIQQTVAWAFGPANNWALNVTIALPSTILLALFSWYVIEKPFLKIKKFIVKNKQLDRSYFRK